MHLVFSMAQFEPALDPFNNPFRRFHLHQPPSVFLEGDTDKHKSFKIDCLLNECTVRKCKDLAIKYLVQ